MQINIYFKCNFVKDTALRGMISSKSLDEATSKNQVLLKEIEKIMKTSGTQVTEEQIKNEKGNK